MADFFARYPVQGGGGSGTVTEITADAPIYITDPTTTPNISMTPASATDEGYVTTGAQELAGVKTFLANTEFAGTLDAITGNALQIGNVNAISVTLGKTTPPSSSYVSINTNYIESDVYDVASDRASGHYIGLSEQSTYIYDDIANTSSSVSLFGNGVIEVEGTGALSITNPTINLDLQNIKNMANPVDPQDAATKDYVDDSIAAIPDPITYQGTYNATTNTPTLSNLDTGVEGYLYQVTVAGTQNFGAGAISFEIGDKVVNNGTIWEKWDMTDSVTSVNGQAGVVVLDTDDIAEGVTNLYYEDARVAALVTPTVDYVNRQLKQSTFIAANWDSLGFDMYDSVNTSNRRITGLGSSDYYTGTNINARQLSNRSFGIAAAGTATISLGSSKFYSLSYSAIRNSGGNDGKTGTILVAKENLGNNTNAAISDTGVSTNVSMDSIAFSVDASGNLLITNGTAFTIDLKFMITQL